MLWAYVLLFLVSCAVLYFSSEWVIKNLSEIARFLCWREFVVAFFVVAVAGSLPNLFVGISSALQKIPELSFGDVAGNNLIVLTVAVALATLFSKHGLPSGSRAIQTTSLFTMASAILPLVLVLDKELSRTDGVILIAFFIVYIVWLFSKKERFSKTYECKEETVNRNLGSFLKDLGKIAISLVLMGFSARGIVESAYFFADNFHLSLILIGIFVTGVGSTLPETYFAVASAKKGENWLILGDLMGAVIIPATLVLGIVALISPFKVSDFSYLVIARVALVISALFFFFFVRTDKHVNKSEAFILLLIYLAFVVAEIFAI